VSFVSELKRRNVIRMAGLYIVGAWLILQVSETLLPIFDTPNWVLKLLVYGLFIGFIPTMIVAWIFELTPDGLKRDQDVVPEQSIAPQTARRMERLIIALFAFALIFFAFDKFVLAPKREASLVADTTEVAVQKAVAKIDADRSKVNPSSIAVLPFADLSQAGDQSYFSDGMAEEILNVLAKVEGLQVASRTSAFAFKGDESQGIPAIARQLSVRHVLEGSVRRSGGTIRITAQLIDAEVDRHLWSETYDRPLTAENVFAIQDEIAKAIVAALVKAMPAAEVGAVGRVTTASNLGAYDNYLQARALMRARRQLEIADQLLEKSLKQDPKFAPAWELRAGLQALLVEYTDTPLSFEEHERRGYKFADEALSLNPDSAMALAVKANLKMRAVSRLRGRYDLADVIVDFERSLKIDPDNPDTLNWYGLTLGTVGYPDKALEMFQRCMRADPRASACTENEYDALYELGRFNEAWEHYVSAFNRGAITDQYANFGLLAHFKQKAAFLFVSNQSKYLPRWHRHEALYEAYRNLDADHGELVREVLTFAAREQIDVDNGYVALVLLPLGAYDLLPTLGLVWGNDHRRYRQTPQFKRIIRESGVYDYWLKAGFPPQCRAAGKEDFICD
jgi:TolB-like protein/Tfp pilus assembly protein PilF